MQILKKYVLPLLSSFALVLLVDLLTNGATEKYLFDSNIYLGIAERGFETDLLISPFIYRYATPLLARLLHQFVGLSIYKSFKLITYLGGIGQLFGIYLIVHSLTRSQKSAYTGMLVVAFSMYNLKYLLFDVHRADALAYAVILLCTWLAFKKQFYPLLLLTMLGLQVREFIIVPLLAYLVTRILQERMRRSLREILISVSGLFVAIVLPRIFIPIIASEQTIRLSAAGIEDLVRLLSLWRRHINLVYVCFAYFLPVIILSRRANLRKMRHELSMEKWIFLSSYAAFVFLLTFVGGTDMERFASYFFLPMAVFVGFFVKERSLIGVMIVLALQFIFNRIWLVFPIWNYDLFASFYGGWSNIINTATIWRYVEVLSYAFIGNYIVHLTTNSNDTLGRAVNKKEEIVK